MVYPHIQYEGPAHQADTGSESPAGIRELDSRVSDGIHVRLLWHERDGHVSVAVHDTRTGELFDLPGSRRRAAVGRLPASLRLRRRRADCPGGTWRDGGVADGAGAGPDAGLPPTNPGQAAVNSRSARSQLPSSSAPEPPRWRK